MSALRRLAASALLSLLMVTAAPASAQPTDVAVKAAFLPRFTRYVEWPPPARPAAGSPLILCIIGTDPFGPLADQAAQRQLVDGHRIIVRRLEGIPQPSACHAAFVRGSRNLPAGQILAALADQPVLTVTDAANGGPRGVIHFQIVGGRVRFLIDNGAARRKGLVLSSRLLALAQNVRSQ